MKKFGFDNLLVSDREIFDVIYSQKKRLPNDKLIELCRNYGVFLSANEDRESICKFISTQLFDWNKLKSLLDKINHDEQNSKSTTIKFSGTQLKHFRDAIKEMAPLYEENQMSHSGKGNSKFEVNLTTSSVELSNTRLIQKPLKDQNLTVEKSGSDVILRFDSEDVLEPIIKDLVNRVTAKSSGKLKSKEVSLEEIKISDYRTNFFLDLITVDNKRYLLNDVKRIKVHHIKTNSTQEFDQEVLDEDAGFLRSAQLSGSSLHTNPLYKEMKKNGHYITEITWWAEDTQENKLLEITAGFLNPKNCTNFFYELKCYYKKTLKGDRYTSERLKFKDIEKSNFLKFFDIFLYSVLDASIQKYHDSLVVSDE